MLIDALIFFDPRIAIKSLSQYSLESILGITLLGGLAGIDSFNGLADFAEVHYDSLKQYFDLPDKSPSHDTFQRILNAVNPEEFHIIHSLSLLMHWQPLNKDLQGFLFGDKGYLSSKTAAELPKQGLHLITKVKSDMKPKPILKPILDTNKPLLHKLGLI